MKRDRMRELYKDNMEDSGEGEIVLYPDYINTNIIAVAFVL